MTSQEEKTWAMMCHLSALAMFVIPSWGCVIGPLTVWLLKKDVSPLVDAHGREALNFNITMAIAHIVAALSLCILIGFVLLPAVAIVHVVVIIVASVAANDGRPYRYPLTIRFIN